MQTDEMMPHTMPQLVPLMTQSSWTQMMQNNEMVPHVMQNLKQELILRMEMILKRRSI